MEPSRAAILEGPDELGERGRRCVGARSPRDGPEPPEPEARVFYVSIPDVVEQMVGKLFRAGLQRRGGAGAPLSTRQRLSEIVVVAAAVVFVVLPVSVSALPLG